MASRIKAFFHCKACMSGQLAVGWTIEGMQVYCEKCDISIIDIDFKGKKLDLYQSKDKVNKKEGK